jgi:hypothetical protein
MRQYTVQAKAILDQLEPLTELGEGLMAAQAARLADISHLMEEQIATFHQFEAALREAGFTR